MSNFLNFIDEDIEAKKTLITTMPTRTKRNKKALNDKVIAVEEKYLTYESHVKKYITTKSKSFEIKNNKNLDAIKNEIKNLEYVKFIINPTNSYFEKLKFDELFYKIGNYYNFSFDFLNSVIREFLNIFDMAGIKLNKEEFNTTCYVNEYMSAYLEVKDNHYETVSKIFENIYWLNPEIIQHIELNFRQLIKKYKKKFVSYVNELATKAMKENNINSYKECTNKLKIAYEKLNEMSKENVSDIIDLVKNHNIDMNQYFEDSKARIETYKTLMADSLDLKDNNIKNDFYDDLYRLKNNVKEYQRFLELTPLINAFKMEFEGSIPKDNKKVKNYNLNTIEKQIKEKESKLTKINNKIFGKLEFLRVKQEKELKILKVNSVETAKELYELYKNYEEECFKEKVLIVLNNSITVADFLNLYYSYNYFKKMAIKKVYELTTYEEVVKQSDSFDEFASDPTNMIVRGLLLFAENDIVQNIMNKYRLNSINLTVDMLDESSLNDLLDKINMLLRINIIENSETTIEKIWFIGEVNKLVSE